MARSELCVLVIVCFSAFAFAQNEAPKCFQFRWMGPTLTHGSPDKSKNCSDVKEAPCIEPLIIQKELPDTAKIWQDKDTDKLCDMGSGNVCIKYTFIYNNAIVNMSHYCGKMIEDKTTAVTDTCYYQNVDGYTIYACACRSLIGGMPCNESARTESFVMLAIICSLIGLFNSAL